MRQVNLRVYREVEDDVEAVLQEHDLDYLSIRDDGDENGKPGTLFMFPLPSSAVSPVFHDLTDAGVGEEAYNVLAKAEHVETPRYEQTRAEYSDQVQGLSRRELRSKVLGMQWPRLTYYMGTVLSVIVATAGLLLDSPAVLIGAMVIAPQVSSALSLTAGVIHGDWDLFTNSAKRQTLGLTLAIVGAAAFTWFVRWTGFLPSETTILMLDLFGLRLAPTFLSSVAAVAAGAVGAFGFMTDRTTSLIGVMITAAIVPAAAAVGIAAAWGAPIVVVGAFALLAVNTVAVNVGGLVTLLLIGYRPVWVDETTLADSLPETGRATIGAVALLFALSIVVAGVLGGMHVGYEQSMNGAVDDTFDDPQYAGLSLVSASSQYGGWAGETPNVTVTAIRTTNTNHSSLAPTLERRIEERTGRDVRVSVQYTESSSSNVSDVSGRVAPVADRTENQALAATTRPVQPLAPHSFPASAGALG